MKQGKRIHLWGFSSIFLTLLLSLLSLISTPKTAAQQSPLVPLAGRWQITGVRVDETLSRTPYYNYDDVRLVGRTVTISTHQIQTDMPENSTCSKPTVRVVESTPDVLLQESMGRHKGGQGQRAKDFGLPVKENQTVRVFWIECKKGDIGPDTPFGPEGQNWLTILPDGLLAMRWYDNILLLKKVPSTVTK